MNQKIKSFYLTYQGRVATPNFENGVGVASKVIVLADAFSALGYEMEVRAELVYDNSKQDGE